MKAVLESLKILIPKQMADIRAAYIVPDPDLLPSVVQYPCVGIKDGGQSFSEGVDQTESQTGIVLIYIYQQILKEEASIMGGGGKKGILELKDDLRSLLNWNTLDDIINYGYIGEVLPSETMFAGENIFVQRIGCKFNYEVEP